jgi:hypothetical protein
MAELCLALLTWTLAGGVIATLIVMAALGLVFWWNRKLD